MIWQRQAHFFGWGNFPMFCRYDPQRQVDALLLKERGEVAGWYDVGLRPGGPTYFPQPKLRSLLA